MPKLEDNCIDQIDNVQLIEASLPAETGKIFNFSLVSKVKLAPIISSAQLFPPFFYLLSSTF